MASLKTLRVIGVVITWLTLLGAVSIINGHHQREVPPGEFPQSSPSSFFYTCKPDYVQKRTIPPVRKLPSHLLPNGTERPYLSAFPDGTCPPQTICLLDYWVDEDNCKRKLNNQPGFQEDYVCVCQVRTAIPINGTCTETDDELHPLGLQVNHYSSINIDSDNASSSSTLHFTHCEEAILQKETFAHLESLTKGLGYGSKCNWTTELHFINLMEELYRRGERDGGGGFPVSYVGLYTLRNLFPVGTQLCDRSKLLQPWRTKKETGPFGSNDDCICACTNGTEVRRSQDEDGGIARSRYCYAYGGTKCGNNNYIESILSDPQVMFVLTPRQLRSSRAHYGLVLPSKSPEACGENSCLWPDTSSGKGNKCLPDPHLQCPPRKWFRLPHSHTLQIVDMERLQKIAKDDSYYYYYYLGREHLDYQYQHNVTVPGIDELYDEEDVEDVVGARESGRTAWAKKWADYLRKLLRTEVENARLVFTIGGDDGYVLASMKCFVAFRLTISLIYIISDIFRYINFYYF